MTRRGLLGMLAAAALDPERAVWVPGKNLVSIPAVRADPRQMIKCPWGSTTELEHAIIVEMRPGGGPPFSPVTMATESLLRIASAAKSEAYAAGRAYTPQLRSLLKYLKQGR